MEQRQFEAMLGDAEVRLRRLRTLYDQWFHGLERTEPQHQRQDVDKLINQLRRNQPRNTALRFRLNQLVQRYTTYNTYWQRISRQIEEGTYKRDVLRARRRAAENAQLREQAATGYEVDIDIDLESALDAVAPSSAPPAAASSHPPGSDRPSGRMREITPFAMPAVVAEVEASVHRSAGSSALKSPLPAPGIRPPPPPGKVPAPPVPKVQGLGAVARGSAAPSAARSLPPMPAARVARPAAAAAGAGNGMTEEKLQGIYQRYLEARRNNQERTDNVRLETVAKSVRDMLPKLREKHAGKEIDFEVVVRDGRVALKPVAR